MYERHRHRWEVNPATTTRSTSHGMVISGNSHKGGSPRSSSSPTIRSSSPASSIPSCDRGRRGPTRFSATSSAPRRPTGARRLSVRSRPPDRHGCPRSLRLGDAPRYRGEFVRVDVEQWPGLAPWEIVRIHDATAVLPVLPDDRVLLVQQFRPAVRQALTEIPAGLLDVDGEDALTAAGRELFEETGYRHSAIEFLGRLYPSAGSSDRVRASVLGPRSAGARGARGSMASRSRGAAAGMIEAARGGRVRDGRRPWRCCWPRAGRRCRRP